tara:strand:- start:814 stop:1032 length:219 start_codon:yes stop_codon:yes gene_type:complete
MGFLAPKPPPPPPLPPPPKLPPATPDDFTQDQNDAIDTLISNKKKGYTKTIHTSTQGDTSNANISYNTLLGE